MSAKSWDFQKDLYNQIFALTPDMDEGDLILFENKNLINTKYINSYTGWQFPNVPELLAHFPSDFEAPPRLILTQSDPEDYFLIHNSEGLLCPNIALPLRFPGSSVCLQPKNLI